MAIAARQTQDYSTAWHWLETLQADTLPPDSWTAKLWVEWATLLASQQRWSEISPVIKAFDALATHADARDRLVMDLWRAYLLREPVNPASIRSAIREDYEERLPFVLGTLCNTLAPPHPPEPRRASVGSASLGGLRTGFPCGCAKPESMGRRFFRARDAYAAFVDIL